MSENLNDKAVKNDPNLGNEFLLPPKLKALAELCAKNEGRYSMQGVILKRTPDGYEACATDGRFLGRVRGRFPEEIKDFPPLERHDLLRTAPAAEAIIPLAAWKEAMALPPKQGKYDPKPVLANVLVRTYAEEATFAATDLEKTRTMATRLQEGRYPAYDEVIPEDDKCLTVDVDADKLIALLKVAKEFTEGKVSGDREPCRVRLEIRRGRKWVKPLKVVAASRDEEFTGILMPLSGPAEEV